MGNKTDYKVLHICPDYPYTKLYDLLIDQLEENLQNTVYVQTSDFNTRTKYPVIYLGRDFGVIDRLLFFRKQYIIKKDIEKRDLCASHNIIHAHNLFSAGYTARLLSKKFKIPYIVAVRNTDVNDFFHYMVHLRSTGVKVMRDAYAVVFLSPAYKKLVIEKYVPKRYRDAIEKKSLVIPNGIDRLFLDNSPQEAKRLFDNKTLRLVYVGEVNTNKNVSTTLKACEILEKKGYCITLTVVGRISESQYENIKQSRFVHYYPQSPKEEVIKHYRQNDIFIMPSLKETFGLVYVEAISQGLPIIYSKGQGIDGYFEEGVVGYHVKSKNAQEIVDAVIKIIPEYNEMSKRCIKVAQLFSWKKITVQYNDIYKQSQNN